MRVFWIVLDSVGIGGAPDAQMFGDEGSNTLKRCYNSGKLKIPTLQKLGLFNIDGMGYGISTLHPMADYARAVEISMGKDTTTGHWEMAGLVSVRPFPTYPKGFPREVIDEFEKRTGCKILCNLPYSGTEVLKDYGQEHIKTGKLIVYTSADSVFQIAAHEDLVPVNKLYEYCETAREILQGEHAVARVIARPFTGVAPNFIRTERRHDFSLEPQGMTVLDTLVRTGKKVIGVGKIYDIFAGKGISETTPNYGNIANMNKTITIADQDFDGLCYVNLVDFDMIYGHRRDIAGYTEALNQFDRELQKLLGKMRKDDYLIITADHGCDPGFKGTDHTRECVPVLCYNPMRSVGVNLGTRETFADMAATIAQIFGLEYVCIGKSFLRPGDVTECGKI